MGNVTVMTVTPARAMISTGLCKVIVSPWAAKVTSPVSQRCVAFPLLLEPDSVTASPIARTVTGRGGEMVAHWVQVRSVILRSWPVGFKITSRSCHNVHMPTRRVNRTVCGVVAASAAGCGACSTLAMARMAAASALSKVRCGIIGAPRSNAIATQRLRARRLRLGQRGDRRPQQPGVYPLELLQQTSREIGWRLRLPRFRFCLLWGRLRGRPAAPCQSWRSLGYRRGPLELHGSHYARRVPMRASGRLRPTQVGLCECLQRRAVPVARPQDSLARETPLRPQPIPNYQPLR